jgi:GT2 family glycosyltransferase
MNLGIKASHGGIIVRLDTHAVYPVNYISVLVNKLVELNAGNVGAPCRTDVLNKTSKTLAIREVLRNKVGIGNSTFRLGINKIKEVDTVPFGCWRREAFDKFGYFDIRLARNQDLELNKRIKKGGGKIYIVPDTYCTYFARETYKNIAKNAYDNGKWNILTVFYKKDLSSLSIRHYVPAVFLFSFLLPLLFVKIFFPAVYISLSSICAYLSLVIFTSIALAVKKKLNFIYLFFAFVTLHVSNGAGAIMGLIQCLYLKMRVKS